MQNILNNNFQFLELSSKWGKAFLLETNNVEKTSDTIKHIIKTKILNVTQGSLLDNPDFLEIVPEKDAKYINLNQVRKMSIFFRSSSIYSGKKIVLIKNAEMLNVYSGNSILKQIEELGKNDLAIFVTVNFNMMLNSLHNRCIRLRNFYDMPESCFEQKYSVFFLKSESIEDKIFFIEKITSSKDKSDWQNFIANTELLAKNLLLKSLKNCSLSKVEEQIFEQFVDKSHKKFFLLTRKIYNIFNDQIKYELDIKASILQIFHEFNQC